MYRFVKLCTKTHRHGRVIFNRNPLYSLCADLCKPIRSQSTVVAKTNFDELIRTRRTEAARSILVQVNSEKSYPELFRYCSQFGHILSAHHYGNNEESHYILLEFREREAAQAAVGSSTFNEDSAGTVVQSPFLWFRAGPKGSKLEKAPTELVAPSSLSTLDGNRVLVDREVNDELRRLPSLSAQMKSLHQAARLNDVGSRLRFLAARQVEQAMHGIFPNAIAFPFGSSVNGFGRLGCDLDLILRLSSEEKVADPNSRLVFHTKENLSNGRSQTQRQMESISDLLQLFLPGVCHVRRILQARVPIIKYHHDHLDLEVDLSMSNLTGVYMSEILYMFGNIDDRVQPLVFSVRRWAQSVGLTNPSPGRWISNFSLTCLVIFYLQQLPQPILPSVDTLLAQARPQDQRITEDGINCSFLRDLNALQFRTENRTELGQLLIDFFEFYSLMDFKERAISLNAGAAVSKVDHSPVYIVNPLETHLNVSKNVSIEECERFRIEVRNAAWALDSQPQPGAGAEWGLLSISRIASNTNVVRPNMFFKPRMVDVSELFGGSAEQDDPQPPAVGNKFKNDTIKSVVEKIQRKGRSDMQQLNQRLGAVSSPSGNNAQAVSSGKALNLPARTRKR